MTADSSKKAIAQFFDDMSATRNQLFRSNPILDYEQTVRSKAVLDALDARPGDRILDIGCGNARDIIPLLRAGATVVGIDISEGMIRQAEADLAAAGQHAVALEVGDATCLNFPSESFDKVLCSEVIEHIPDADQAVRECYRVLKRGGTVVVSTPNRRSWYGFDRYVVWTRFLRKRWNHPFDRWRTMGELTTLLHAHGFTIAGSRSECYVPGFVLTYKLPWRRAQEAIVWLVRNISPVCSRVAPRNGYLLVVRALK